MFIDYKTDFVLRDAEFTTNCNNKVSELFLSSRGLVAVTYCRIILERTDHVTSLMLIDDVQASTSRRIILERTDHVTSLMLIDDVQASTSRRIILERTDHVTSLMLIEDVQASTPRRIILERTILRLNFIGDVQQPILEMMPPSTAHRCRASTAGRVQIAG
jgi:archaellum component FlaD/FlaE